MIYDQKELNTIGLELKKILMDSSDNFNKVIQYLNQIDILDSLRERIGLTQSNEFKNNPYGMIYIIGQSEVSKHTLTTIATDFGIDKSRLRFCIDYSETKNFNYSSLRYNENIALVMIGPMPHSTNGKGHHSSTLSHLKNTEGYPPVCTIGLETLKITKAGYKRALTELIQKDIISINR